MYQIFRTGGFKKDYKKLTNSDKTLLKEVVTTLAVGNKLNIKYKDHKLVGNFVNCRECHVKPDLLLIYKIDKNVLELALVRVGSHSKLFK
jgi:mRNA interferase YafQ